MEGRTQVIFKLGKDEYGIEIMYVNAIEKYTNIIPVPNAPSYIDGIINLRGDVIPVYSLRSKFHLDKNMVQDDTNLIVAKSNGLLIAFQVDSVEEIVDIEGKDINDPPLIIMTEDTKYIDKIASIRGRMIILLNLDGILSNKEQANLEEILSAQKA